MIGKYTRTLQIRAERHARAVTIQEANRRTPQEQLAHLDKMGLVAAKERAKIAQKLKREAEAAAAQKKGKK